MCKEISMRRWFAAIVSVLIIAFLSGFVYSGSKHETEDRNGVITLDSSARFHKDERAPVYFFHDLHTDAVNPVNGNCTTCHMKKNGKMVFRFIESESGSWEDQMNGYHDKCIGCHSKTIATGKKGGPVICSGCHRDDVQYGTSGFSARLDKSLHQRHTIAMNRKCESCHHVYDDVTKKTVYQKGREGSCAYCHPTVDNRKDMTLQKASHGQCITCHMSKAEIGQSAGPVRCEGCHDASLRQTYAKVTETERLNMGQKNLMMLDAFDKQPMESTPNRMDFVPFSHLNHEKANESCRVCHHKALKSCTQCHTQRGSEKGGGVNLETAMHKPGTERSCLGCHKEKQAAKDCAGCHAFDVAKAGDKKQCVACHAARELGADQETQARDLIQSKTAQKEIVADSEIPETLVLNKLEKIYEPVNFPHRKIVKALAGKLNDSTMALYFHQGKYSLCMGCHHNTPDTGTPTACSSCHSIEDTSHAAAKPGLMGAYHIQCMECHARMKIRQPESCTQCHKEKR